MTLIWVAVPIVAVLALPLVGAARTYVLFRRMSRVPLSVVPCVVWYYSVWGRMRRLRRTFGAEWSKNADLCRLRDSLLMLLMRGTYLYRKSGVARSRFPVTEGAQAKFQYALLLVECLAWVRSSEGLRATKDEGWLALLVIFGTALGQLGEAVASLGNLKAVDAASPPADQDTAAMTALGRITWAMPVAHGALVAMQRMI
jgi:hypothetical protein